MMAETKRRLREGNLNKSLPPRPPPGNGPSTAGGRELRLAARPPARFISLSRPPRTWTRSAPFPSRERRKGAKIARLSLFCLSVIEFEATNRTTSPKLRCLFPVRQRALARTEVADHTSTMNSALRTLWAVLLCSSASLAAGLVASAAPPADTLLSQSKVQAAAEHKSIFLMFDASW